MSAPLLALPCALGILDWGQGGLWDEGQSSCLCLDSSLGSKQSGGGGHPFCALLPVPVLAASTWQRFMVLKRALREEKRPFTWGLFGRGWRWTLELFAERLIGQAELGEGLGDSTGSL